MAPACWARSILPGWLHRPFEEGAEIDEEELAELTATAVRMLDNVIDISRYPLPQQEAEAKAKRRIGLGVTGLADALLFCGKIYGSSEAVEQTRRWLGDHQARGLSDIGPAGRREGGIPAVR